MLGNSENLIVAAECFMFLAGFITCWGFFAVPARRCAAEAEALATRDLSLEFAAEWNKGYNKGFDTCNRWHSDPELRESYENLRKAFPAFFQALANAKK